MWLIKSLAILIGLIFGITDAQNAIFWRPNSIAMQPGGDAIAIQIPEGILIFDGATAQQRLAITDTPAITSKLTWNNAGTRIAGLGDDATIYVWDAITGKVALTMPAHASGTSELAWTSDDTHLFGFGIEEENSWWFWDANTGEISSKLSGGTVINAVFSPSKTKLALANINQVVIVNAATFEYITTLQQPEMTGLGYDIYPIAWSADETQMATGSLNGTIRIWDVQEGEILHTWRASSDPKTEGEGSLVGALTFSHDGRTLYSVRTDGTLREWDITSGEVIAEERLASQVLPLEFSSYGGQLVYGMPPEDLNKRAAAPGDKLLPNLAAQITVPFPSVERVRDIAAACLRDATDKAAASTALNPVALNALTNNLMPNFIAQVNTIPSNMIPQACKADLLAIAQAVR